MANSFCKEGGWDCDRLTGKSPDRADIGSNPIREHTLSFGCVNMCFACVQSRNGLAKLAIVLANNQKVKVAPPTVELVATREG